MYECRETPVFSCPVTRRVTTTLLLSYVFALKLGRCDGNVHDTELHVCLAAKEQSRNRFRIRVIRGFSFNPWPTGQAVRSEDCLACRPRVKREIVSGQIPCCELLRFISSVIWYLVRVQFSGLVCAVDGVFRRLQGRLRQLWPSGATRRG